MGDSIAMRFGGLIEEVYLAGNGFFAFLFLGGDPGIQGGALQERPACWGGRVSRWESECGTVARGCRRCSCLNSSMACHTRSFPSRHGTLMQRISSVAGATSDAICLPPVCGPRVWSSSLPFFSRVTRRRRRTGSRIWWLGERTAGAPEERITSKVRRVWIVNGTSFV